MAVLRQPRYPKEEFALLGDEIYERDIREQVETEHNGEFVAIDIDSGKWELDSDALAACDRLIARRSDSQTWLIRVGFPYVHRLVGHGRGLMTI